MRNTCLNMIYELAKKDKRVVFIGSDLSLGLLDDMKIHFPDRYYTESVPEANIIDMAAGLAMEGFIPYVNTMATFLTRRCYEQIAVDICMQNLPVRLIGNGGGLVYASLGPTHLAIDDLTLMRALPNMSVIAVSDSHEMKRLMEASLGWPQPLYIRLAKGGDEIISQNALGFTIGKAIKLHQTYLPNNIKILLVSTGIMSQRALQLAKLLETLAISTSVLHCHTIKPLDKISILSHAKIVEVVVTLEENILTGGLGSAILDYLSEKMGRDMPLVKRFGIPDQFSDKYGSQNSLLEYYGLSVEQMFNSITTFLTHHQLDYMPNNNLLLEETCS